ncbi:MAG: cyclic nucleotide-binding domain-containing protein [Leptothrix sp. (in: Bacteria)]|nr:cyclic nucleotide-binding domain-containing protein [Leptothrix sp. (in: b-proteobacteria)]
MTACPPDLRTATRACRLAEGLNDEQTAALAGVLTLQPCEAGEVLAREGTVDNHLYAIVDGTLAIVKQPGQPGEETLITLKAGDLVHELGFLDGKPRYASLRAASEAHVLVLEREGLESLIDSHPRVLYAVMRTILRTGHTMQTRLAVQAAELTNYIVKQHGRY